MLGKLFKYEWKSASQLLLAIHIFVVVFAVLSRITFEFNGGLSNALHNSSNVANAIAILLVFLMVMVIGSVAFFTYVYVAYRFYKTVFTDQGYLTNTLPVTPAQILLAKGAVGVLWIVLDVLFLILTTLILFVNGSFFTEFGKAMSELMEYIAQAPAYFWLTILSMILSPFIIVIQLYFCVAVGNLFTGHKVLGAVGTFFGVYVAEQIISVIVLLITGWRIAFGIGTPLTSLGFFNRSLTATLSLGMLFSILCALAFWFGTNHILSRKLNLQ